MKPIAIDLFCGAGGMSEGILQAGFDIVYSNDVNEQVKTTYTMRHEQLGYTQGVNTYFECADIRDLHGKDIFAKINSLEKYKNQNIQEVDAIFGGPPCQGFSRAGLRRKNDPRNMLFKEYVRIIAETRPKYIVMENVEGMLDTKLENYESIDGEVIKGEEYVVNILKREFNKINYKYEEPRLLNAADYGVPQKRKRIIFLGYRHDQIKPTYPQKEETFVTVREALQGIEDEPKTTYAKERRNGVQLSLRSEIQNTEQSKHDVLIKERFSLFQQGETQRQTRTRIESFGVDLSGTPNIVKLLREKKYPFFEEEYIVKKMADAEFITKEDVDIILTKKNSRTRLNEDAPSPTILTSSDDYIHPTENRSLTVREMARLQGFDDSFVFYGKRTTGGKLRKQETPQMTQVGNAVPPILARKIAERIIVALNR